MKTASVPSLFAALLLLLAPFTSLKATNYNNYGTFAAYNLNSGDTLRILQGTFNGVVTNVPAGAVIVVSQNATFAPTAINFWAPAGKVINNGTTRFGSMGIGAGFILENNNIVSVGGNMDLYSGAAKSVINATGAKLTIEGTLSAGENTTITNNGTLSTTGVVNLYANSTLANKGLMVIGGNFNTKANVTNENLIRVAGDFNYWEGQFNNTGAVTPTGTFSISAGMTYVNSCRLITKGGINNSGTLKNNGLIWAGTSNTSADQLTNSGTFINAATAKVRTVNFTNYASITGGGFFYATGETILGSDARIGITGTTTDSIRIYDVTRTSAGSIFDKQWGIVNPNTKYAVFTAPDSIEMFAGCSNTFRMVASGALPVKWNYFYVKQVNGKPVLYWGADYEAGMKFEIERSYNNIDYTVIKTAGSDFSAAYSYTDAALAAGQPVIYYRIRGISAVDGEIKYTKTETVKTGEQASTSVRVYPNPAPGAAALSYTAQATEGILVRIKASNGQQVSLKSAVAIAGVNRIELPETQNLAAGIYFIDVIKGNQILASEKLVKK